MSSIPNGKQSTISKWSSFSRASKRLPRTLEIARQHSMSKSKSWLWRLNLMKSKRSNYAKLRKIKWSSWRQRQGSIRSRTRWKNRSFRKCNFTKAKRGILKNITKNLSLHLWRATIAKINRFFSFTTRRSMISRKSQPNYYSVSLR
jgi:hypothetical protein